MRIAYANTSYRRDRSGGGNAHVGQFVTNAVALGHEIWMWPGNPHPAACCIPDTTFARLKALRRMDVLYVRVEWTPPRVCRWDIPPRRQLYGFPVVAWEFNTVPEFGLLRGKSESAIQLAIQRFRRYSRGCDLAVCVSRGLGDYVRETFAIERVLVVPNGSDPGLFRPDVPPVSRVSSDPKKLNAVWIGSADITWHDFDILGEAARLLWERGTGSQIAFHIIGEGRTGLMQQMPPNVFYWGPEYYDLLPHWLAAMDVGLCLYHPGPGDYSSPLKLFDYMASSLTVVGTDQPQLREVFGELGQTDLLVPPGNAGVLADVLLRLAGDRDRVRRQGRLGRKLVIDHFNWYRVTRDTLNEIERILRGKIG